VTTNSQAIPPLPDGVRARTPTQVDDHRVPWSLTEFWKSALDQHQELQEALVEENQVNDGIRRSFVKSYATGNPDELFLAAMAWGFGSTNVRWPDHKAMLTAPLASDDLAGIINAVRTGGAGQGWSALSGSHHIPGLGKAFGTKLLYFAGYESNCPGPRPLILDNRVSCGLARYVPGWKDRYATTRDEYLWYLEIAQAWAQTESWNGDEEAVEFALFELGNSQN